MPLTLSGTNGVSGVDGSASTPANRGSDTNTGIVYGTDTVQIATGGTTAVTVDSNGRVGIGTTSPDAGALMTLYSSTNTPFYLTSGDATNCYQYFKDAGSSAYQVAIGSSANAMKLVTGGAERARIDSSGNLLVGTTSATGTLTVEASKSGLSTPIGWFKNTNSSGAVNAVMTSLNSNGNGTGSAHLNCVTQTVNNWYLYGNGTTSFSSDERLKKDIQTARDGYLDDVMKLRVVKYRWHNQDEDTPQELGFIAQEMEQVFPGLVIEHELEGVGVRKNIKHSVMEFILTKAIQELSAKLDAAEARIAALEAK